MVLQAFRVHQAEVKPLQGQRGTDAEARMDRGLEDSMGSSPRENSHAAASTGCSAAARAPLRGGPSWPGSRAGPARSPWPCSAPRPATDTQRKAFSQDVGEAEASVNLSLRPNYSDRYTSLCVTCPQLIAI